MNKLMMNIFKVAQNHAICASAMSSAGFEFGAETLWETAMVELKAAYGMQPIAWYEQEAGKYEL